MRGEEITTGEWKDGVFKIVLENIWNQPQQEKQKQQTERVVSRNERWTEENGGN